MDSPTATSEHISQRGYGAGGPMPGAAAGADRRASEADDAGRDEVKSFDRWLDTAKQDRAEPPASPTSQADDAVTTSEETSAPAGTVADDVPRSEPENSTADAPIADVPTTETIAQSQSAGVGTPSHAATNVQPEVAEFGVADHPNSNKGEAKAQAFTVDQALAVLSDGAPAVAFDQGPAALTGAGQAIADNRSSAATVPSRPTAAVGGSPIVQAPTGPSSPQAVIAAPGLNALEMRFQGRVGFENETEFLLSPPPRPAQIELTGLVSGVKPQSVPLPNSGASMFPAPPEPVVGDNKMTGAAAALSSKRMEVAQAMVQKAATAATGEAALGTPFSALGNDGDAAADLATIPSDAASPRAAALRDLAHLPRSAANVPAAAAQIAVQIGKAVQEGMSRISVQLNPPELGRVDIKLDVGFDGRVLAVISAERLETLELLQRDARLLERAFQDAGLEADSGSLSFSLRDQGAETWSEAGALGGTDSEAAESTEDETLRTINSQFALNRGNRALDIRV